MLRRNTANANDADGIAIEAEAPPGSGTLLDRNVTNENSSDGITVNKVGHTLVGNTANNNGSWGMYATVPTVLGANVDGGGNRATGNTQLEQCFQIRCDGGAPVTETLPPETTITDGPPDTTPFGDATFRFTGHGQLAAPARVRVPARRRRVAGLRQPALRRRARGRRARLRGARDRPRGQRRPDPGARRVDARAAALRRARRRRRSTARPTASPRRRARPSRSPPTSPARRFECRLDGGAWALCEPPRTYTGLAQGAHEFAVRAIDAEDLVDGSPATFAWTIGAAAAAGGGQLRPGA